jgi:hypothetical protein
MTRDRVQEPQERKMLPDVSSESKRKTRLLRYTLTNTRILRIVITDSGRVNANSQYHAVPLPCHAAKGLDCVFPI